MNDLNSSRKPAARTRPGCFLALFLLAGFPAPVTPVRADNPPTYLYQIDSSVLPNGFNPQFITLDSSNNVYVTSGYGYNAGSHTVTKFDNHGNYLTQWGSAGSGNGQFSSPQEGIAVDSSNNVYVVDGGSARVEKFTSSGTYLAQWGTNGSGNGQLLNPEGIAVDSSNNVYVVDGGNARVEKFTSSGTYLAQWGTNGSGNGQLLNPVGIAVDSSNNVYVADEGNGRVEKFTSGGTSLTQWGSVGFGNGQFRGAFGIAVDSSNNVYVGDLVNDYVQRFDGNGNYLAQWDSNGSSNGQFEQPLGVAVDSTGNFIYVADSGNGRIDVFANNVNIIAPIITQQPTNQTVLAGTNVTFTVGVPVAATYAYQWNSNNVAISGATNAAFTLNDVSPSVSAVYSVLVTNSFGSVLSSNAVLTVFPFIITQQPTNQIIAAGANVTFSIGVAGFAPVYQWNSNSIAISGATNATLTLAYVGLSASGSTYSVLVTNSYGSQLSSNAVLTVLPADEIPATYSFQVGGVDGPLDVALDSSNNMYVLSFEYSAPILKYASGGNYLAGLGAFGTNNGPYEGTGQFEYPYGIAVDSSNNLYVTDEYNDRVEKLDSNGNYLAQWGSYGSGHGQFYAPYGIAVDSSNNVYVADYENSRVEKFDHNGSYLTQWGSFGSGHGQFNGVYNIGVDSSNSVYVVDYNNNRIEKFTSNGSYLTQWGSAGSGNGQFNGPAYVAVDSGNNVYVTDYNNDRVEKFDRNGNYLTQWGSAGSGNGQLSNPRGVAVDGNNIYVADSGNNRIEVFTNSVPATLPIPLNISLTGAQMVLRWNNPAFSLQSAPAVTGPWTTLSSATSPYTNVISDPQMFFRLMH